MLGLSLPVLILILGLGLCCLALIAAVLLLHFKYSAARDKVKRSGNILQNIYFDARTSLNKAISEGHPFAHCAAEFNNSLTRKFNIKKLVIYISAQNRFNPLIWRNIDLPGINRLYFAANSELVKKLGHGGQPIKFDWDKPSDNLGKLLYEKLDMKAAFPLIFGKQMIGFVVVSDSETYSFDELSDYILSLTDQLSYAFQLSKRATIQSRTREKSKPVVRDSSVKEAHEDYSALLEAGTNFMKIYNETQLFDVFLNTIEKHFQPSFAVLFLSENQKNTMTARYFSGKVPSQIKNQELRQGDSLMDILSRDQRLHRMEHIQEALGVSPTIRIFSDAGCRLISSFQMPQRQLGFLVMGVRGRDGSDYSSEDLNIIATFCQTLRLTLDNIHQFRKIEELSYTDSMTGMYNYRYFYKRLSEEILRAHRFERNLALVIFDIDEFKVINDSYGHQTGDHILKQLGLLIHNSVRSIDIVSRYGGEEFCVIMPETDGEACEQFMERLRIKISEFEFRDRSGKKSLNIRVSLGGAIFPADAIRIDRLIYCADMALLESKKSGRNKVCLYNPAIESGREQL